MLNPRQKMMKILLVTVTILSVLTSSGTGMMMMGGKKHGVQGSGIETLLAAGILAKLLGSSESKGSSHPQPVYIPYPVMPMMMGHQSMGGYQSMGGGGGHGGMGGY